MNAKDKKSKPQDGAARKKGLKGQTPGRKGGFPKKSKAADPFMDDEDDDDALSLDVDFGEDNFLEPDDSDDDDSW
ncbi:MAG: hypothetical protein H6585_13205 [Flavobacteriales bacterium]|nr:hypothetical protein [Flavobacteriales bacterium]MCB9449291.1 hypothetical protein [Flavobacteriales bacterium]